MRILLAAIILVSLPASAKTPIPMPDYDAVAKASEICSAKGAFGRAFARSGRVDTTAEPDWAPFTKLSLSAKEIHAEASFHGTSDSLEGDIKEASDFRHALDKALTAKHVFKDRKVHDNGVEFHSSEDPASGVAFYLRQTEEHISADCVDLDR